MAAAVSSPWAKPGAWALDSEQHEDELNHQHNLDLASAAAQPPPTADFPSLSAAVTVKPKKKSKQVLSLAEFSNYKPPSASLASVDVVLPTGPRERTAEEIAESRRGGFRNYGGDRERSRVSRDESDMGPSRADEAGDWSKTKRVSSFGSGTERERDMGPSRADGVDDWSKGKKLSSFGAAPEREKDMGPSRADGVDDWSKGKKFGEERGERREKMGFFNSSRADDVDNWAVKKGYGFGSGLGRERERRVGFEATGPGSDVDNWVKGKDTNSSNGSGRPRLNLQPRTLPVVDKEDGNVSGSVKGKGNPFGAARPREEVLKEKGKDWKEIDEKMESVKMKEVERSSGSSFDSIGRRRGVGVVAGDDRSVKGGWRKTDSPISYAAAAAAPPRFHSSQ